MKIMPAKLTALLTAFAKFFAVVVAAALGFGLAPGSASGDSGGEVNLYTDRQEVFLRPALAAFARATGVESNVLFIKAGLLERMRAEGSSSAADVVLVADVGALSDIVSAGLTRKPDAGLAAELSDAVPAAYRDADGEWFGVTRRARIIYASAERASEVRTYDDIADPKFRGRVCIRSGRHPYNIGLVAHMIATRGEAKAREWLLGVKANLARKPQGNDRAQIKGVLSGRCDAGVGNSYYFFQALRNADDEEARDELRAKVVPVYPPDPNVNITGMALARHAPNADNAAKLMRFLVGEQAQKIYAGENQEFPVRDREEWPGELELHRARLQAAGATVKRLAELRMLASRMVEEVGFDR